DALPIPWNADAVIVEANVRLPAISERKKEDFTLQFSTGAATAWAEIVAQPNKQAPLRVFFRMPVPPQTCSAQVFWREHALGRVALPISSAQAYAQGISLEMACLQAVIGDRTVACQACVSGQAKSLLASAVVRAAGPLAAALDLDLQVCIDRRDGREVGTAP